MPVHLEVRYEQVIFLIHLVTGIHRHLQLPQQKIQLETNQDQLITEQAEPALPLPQSHENIRGPKSFH